MAKRTFDMAMSSPDPVQVTNDTEEIPLQNRVQTAVRLQDWTWLINVLSNGEKSEMREIFQNKAYVESLLGDILQSGRLDIVFLLEKDYRVDMNQFIKSNGKACSILCRAVNGGHLDCVHYVLEKGADVNQRCKRHLTPLTQACLGGNKDIVERLIQQGACVEGRVGSTHTPLIAAVLRNHIDIVTGLLQKGANPNATCMGGTTALHEAVYTGGEDVRLVQLLLDQKAELHQDIHGRTPLSLAVILGKVAILDLLLEVKALSREEKIYAWEWCAALRDPGNKDTVFECLQRAMKERYRDPLNILHKPDQVPDPYLGYVVESRSLEELSERKDNCAALLIECLAIRKRSAGYPGIPTGTGWIEDAYSWLETEGHHKEACFLLANETDVAFFNLSFMLESALQKYERMLVEGEIPNFAEVKLYLNACRTHLRNRVDRKNDVDYSSFYIQVIVIGVVKYLSLCIRLVDVGEDKDVQFLAKTAKDISDCLQCHYHPVNRHSILTQAVISWMFCQYDLKTSLLEDLIILLIKSGASIDCRDPDGDTPLHILAKTDHTAACSMARLLLENGADFDLLNFEGQTPAQCAVTEKMKTLLESTVRPLQCLAVHVILEHNLSLDPLPDALKRLVAEHGGIGVQTENVKKAN